MVLMAPLILLLPFGPVTRWQREQPSKPLAMLLPWAVLAVLAGVAAYFLTPQSSWKVLAGVLAAVWVAVGTARFVWTRFSRPDNGRAGKQFTAEMLGMTLAHLGVAVFVIGALLTEGLSQQREVAVMQGQSVELGRYAFRFDGAERYQGPNYTGDRGTVTVFRNDAPLTVLHPEKRAYASGGQVMTEAAIDPGFTRDLYVAMGEPLGGGSWALRVHVKPFVRWIWGGALLMMLGGLVTATDRRFARTEQRKTAEASA
jgi:cytochrome c-type biogenesis protein CcmF